MPKKKPKGWVKEPVRHGLASKGVKTVNHPGAKDLAGDSRALIGRKCPHDNIVLYEGVWRCGECGEIDKDETTEAPEDIGGGPARGPGYRPPSDEGEAEGRRGLGGGPQRVQNQAWKDAQKLAKGLREAGYDGFAEDVEKAMETSDAAVLARKLAKAAQGASEWLASSSNSADLDAAEFDHIHTELVGPIADLAEELGAKVEY